MKTRGKERKLREVVIISLVIAIVFVAFGIASASLYDGAVPDGKIVENKYRLWSAGAIAIDSKGVMYVVDSYRNHILKYSANGAFLGDIKVKQPSAVAVADDGTLYVGSHSDYSVAIIRSGKVSGYLGGGAGEFRSIKDITYDRVNAEVYVVDNVDGKVKVYSADGRYLRAIVGLHLPVSVAIKGGEVYILDEPLTVLSDGKNEEVSTSGRITVYDRDGKLLRNFDSSQGIDSNMINPNDLAVDDSGRVYVADSAKNAVHVYDSVGQYLGLLKDDANPLTLARAVAVNGNKLFVSLSEGNCIRIFKLNNPTSQTPKNNTQMQTVTTEIVSIADQKGNAMTNSVSSNATSSISVSDSLIVASDIINIVGMNGSAVNSFQPFAGMQGSVDVEYADFDGDGAGEIAAAIIGNASKIGLFSADGNNINSFSVDTPVVDITSADIDSDGVKELIVSTGANIDIYGINSEAMVLKDEIAESADMLAAGDVDGDDVVDIAVYDKAAGQLKILDLSGNVKQAQALGVVPVAIKIADLNNSGAESVVVATADGTIFSFDGSIQIKVKANISDIAVKDVNNDGSNEIIVAFNDGTVKVVGLDGTAEADISTGLQADVNITTGQIGY